MRSVRKLTIALIFFTFLNFFSTPIFAQVPNFSIATTYNIDSKNLEDGDILSVSPGKNLLEPSKISYDNLMFGVYIKTPQIVFRTSSGNTPVIRNGEVKVNVTTLLGPIKKGDYITSSEIVGKGAKGRELSGYMLGIALEDFDGKDGKEVTYLGKKYSQGKITVSVGIGPASPILIKTGGGILGTATNIGANFLYNLSSSRDATKVIRYLIAGFVAIATIFINFRTFGRNITQGIESIGRNPLAKVAIQSMIILNIVLIALVSIGGIGLALAIVSF